MVKRISILTHTSTYHVGDKFLSGVYKFNGISGIFCTIIKRFNKNSGEESETSSDKKS
jgi:hypothetical protein